MPGPTKEIVVAAAIVRDGRLLLVEQRKAAALGLWSYPGGHVEAGESLSQALGRELAQEVGLAIVRAFPLRIDRTGELFEHHAYFVTATGDVTLSQSELLGFGWFSLEQIEHMQPLLRAPWIVDIAQIAFAKANTAL